MVNIKRLCIVGMMGCLLLTGQLAADVTISDLDVNDDNSITSVTSPMPGVLWVEEDYNELFLVPYPSHDGYAIVNQSGGFFDKVVHYSDGWEFGHMIHLEFDILNSGPYTWSDYHIEFRDLGLGTPMDVGWPGGYSAGNSVFMNEHFGDNAYTAWSPGAVAPGQHLFVSLSVNLAHFAADPDNGEFGIRQIATTVIPVPGSVVIGAIGLGMIGCWKRRRRKATEG